MSLMQPSRSFAQVQKVASDASGFFSVCSSSTIKQSALVIIAADTQGNIYPGFISSVSASINLGTIALGECTVACALESQQQTSLPATISGLITSNPAAVSGSVMARYTIPALDGSGGLWNLAIPSLDPTQTAAFSTASSADCVGSTLYCTTYRFILPSQKPLMRTSNGYQQGQGSPTYSIYVRADNQASCTPFFSSTDVQQGGKSFLTASQGASLVASGSSLTNCF